MINLSKDNLHHACCLVGNRETLLQHVDDFCTNDLSVSFWKRNFDTFGIEDSRILSDTALQTTTDTKKVFVLAAHTMTVEAQNALLKLFEEPTPDTHFFLIIPSVSILLPTLKSRMDIRVMESEAKKESFLKKPIKDRLAYVTDLIGAIKDGEGMKQEAIDFLTQLEYEESQGEKRAVVLEEILKSKRYINQRGTSLKTVLEHIALVV